MTPLQEQFEILKTYYPNATSEALPSGAVLIVIPDFPLPEGWSHNTTQVKFLAPIGYPFAKPDCFWAHSELRLKSSAMPASANISPIPEISQSHLWFSWHVGQWNPSRDSLLTYVRVIETRLKDPR